MKVTLIDCMPNSGDAKKDEQFMNFIASQSRHETPLSVDGLFNDTKKWGHDSIQEFATYVFHVEDVSVNLLKQLTRHRIASYNVMSHRHVNPSKVVLPKGIKSMSGVITIDDNSIVEWEAYEDGKFRADYIIDNGADKDVGKRWNFKDLKDCQVNLEDIRYGYPCGVSTNLFMKFNGRSLRNFLRLRTDSHAQWEIRDLANAVKLIVGKIHPFMVIDLEEKTK